MSVSPADFELYSRVTGSPLPRSPQEQMRMAPHVYNFIRHNQYAKTKREPSTLQKAAGFLGKAALVGAGLGAIYGASDAFGRDPEPLVDNETLQSDVEVPSPQNEVSTQQGADIPAASFQEDPNQYVVGAYPLASPQTEYPPDNYFSPRGDYNDPENIKFGLPTNKAGRAQLSKFIDTLHAPQINEELIGDNSQLVDHPDLPGGEVPHTPQSQAAEDRLVEQAINERIFESPNVRQLFTPEQSSSMSEAGVTHGGDIYSRFRNTPDTTYVYKTDISDAETFEDLVNSGALTHGDVSPSLLVRAMINRTKEYKQGPEGWE